VTPTGPRLAQAILRDERIVLPVATYPETYGATLSLPSVLGRQGVTSVFEPAMSDAERRQLECSAARLRSAPGGDTVRKEAA
jgi:L-lactate dehydrogenase